MKEKIYWLVGSEEDKPYQSTTWVRCMGIQNFVERVEQEKKIVGIVCSDNNLGFILEDKIK